MGPLCFYADGAAPGWSGKTRVPLSGTVFQIKIYGFVFGSRLDVHGTEKAIRSLSSSCF